jgi:hypothetical protein
MSILTFEELEVFFGEPEKAKPRTVRKAEILSFPTGTILRCCQTCQHMSKPGLSAGHCGGRDDLPPAYGQGHPLRKLPPDAGADCKEWMAHTGNRFLVLKKKGVSYETF